MRGTSRARTNRLDRSFPEELPGSVYSTANGPYPLFQCRITRSDGETRELTLGPCIASVVKWIVLGLIAHVLMAGHASTTDVFAIIKMLRLF